MKKLTKEQKKHIYIKRKAGAFLNELSQDYSLRKKGIKYLVKLIDRHGFEVLRDGNCHAFTIQQKGM